MFNNTESYQKVVDLDLGGGDEEREEEEPTRRVV